MEETVDLQEKIAALAGRINRHKTVEGHSPYSHPPNQAPVPARGSYSWTPQRGTPYGAPRGRGWGSRVAPHRHRSLVLNAQGQGQGQGQLQDGQGNISSSTSSGTFGSKETIPASGWITKRDRHMQLINNAVYEQKTQERSQAIEETRKQKQRQREEREKAKVNNHVHALTNNQQYSTSASTGVPIAPQIIINDIRFLVTDGGSKLIKSSDEVNMLKTTPKRATVGGVSFLRSKHGNLYRAGFIKTQRRTAVKKIPQPCPQFSTTGTCSNGPRCRYMHDPEKVAICREFLQTGKCQAGLDCDLSHDPTAERVPACLHFLRGNCTNSDCRYAHVRTNPGAPVCRAFATLGYCSKGAACPERHIHECPDYANKGICRNKKCRLPHVDRAGQLRKAAAIQSSDIDEGESSDISSDDELAAYDSDDVDSDDFGEDFEMPDATSHELSQQNDFVKFR